MRRFQGTGVALVTPFNSDGSIDFSGLEKLVQHCIDGRVEYLVVMGTTGESATLEASEKLEVLRKVQEVNSGRLPIVYGMGGNNTSALVQSINQTDFQGIDGILSVSPYYNKPTQEGIYQHYKAVAQASPVPVILYNVPGRTSSNISADTTLRLARDFDNIIAVKEASGDFDQMMQIINERPEGFLLISGDDNISLPIIASGGDGVISVSGQGFPSTFSQMVRDALTGNMDRAREGHYRLFEATRMLFAEGNPGGIKAVLKHKNICEDHLRLPLWKISEELDRNLSQEVAEQGI